LRYWKVDSKSHQKWEQKLSRKIESGIEFGESSQRGIITLLKRQAFAQFQEFGDCDEYVYSIMQKPINLKKLE
jgi:hypothetical protein